MTFVPVEIVDHDTVVPCRNCDSSCCSAYLVNINHRELYRVAKTLSIDPYVFTFPAYDDDYTDVTDNGFPTFMVEGRPHALALEYVVEEGDRCIFLMTVGEEKRCGIHTFKPILCRAYPHGVTEDWDLEDEADELVCPVEWKINREDRDLMKHNTAAYALEVQEFTHLCQQWNNQGSSDRSFREFLDFLMNHPFRKSPSPAQLIPAD